ncbi:MAG: ABC transporter ATP-binding protein [Nitrospirae bacterium]|nr:ABC transporter ATP-binding protein [Nitrospirota bacterium]
MALIELNKVSKTYRIDGLELTAFSAESLQINTGEFVCIAGPSGSGKTTLLNLIGAIDLPTAGSVSVSGRVTNGISPAESAQMRLDHIGFIFQSYNLIPVLTAYENVEYVLLLKGASAEERKSRVMAALDSVGLREMMKKLPKEMSGGQQQRVAVARAIVASPPIVIADEPTANLDSATGRELVNLLHRLNQNRGTTFVFSSHDPMVIERADRILTLRDGRIVDDRICPEGCTI